MNVSPSIASWFVEFKKSPAYAVFQGGPVAYLSMEYALAPELPTYAGGLGILAADYAKETAAQGFPLHAVGLYYREAQNTLNAQQRRPEEVRQETGLTLLTDERAERILVSIPLGDHEVKTQVWHWNHEGSRVYLLDTDIGENNFSDRGITARLYTDDREMRLKQEILLGIGGFRLLAALGLHCSLYHLNEGHSAFLALELIHHEMKHQKVDFHTAVGYAKKHIIFTNHTLVAAGQELFSTELVSTLFSAYAQKMEVSVADIVALGAIADANLFSMTTLSFQLCVKSNAVSKLHATEARGIWPQHPMEHVTNGIFIPTWDGIDDPDRLREGHLRNKKRLLRYIAETAGETWDERTLLLGWGRRIVPYKRPLIFAEAAERLAALANGEYPFKIVFSGPTGQSTAVTNELAAELQAFIEQKLRGIAVFLPHYNMELGKLMTQGADVWLNTPVIGSEACGTSGMKALLNGTLPLSTRDGWIAEAELSGIGWVVDEPNVAEKILDVLAREIAPLFYKKTSRGAPSAWEQRMRAGRNLIREHFSTARMLKDYIEKMYLPALAERHKDTHA